MNKNDNVKNDIVNEQKNLIAKIMNKKDIKKFIDMTSELSNFINNLQSEYDGYIFTITYNPDYHFIDLNVYHIFENSLPYTLVKDILNSEFDSCAISWIKSYNNGITFIFHI